MESRSQRWFFPGQSATAPFARHHRPGVPLRSDQRRESAEEFVVAPLVDAPRDRDTKEFQSLFPRHSRISFPDNAKVLAFLRRHEDETVLVVVNLSRFAALVELDFAPFSCCVPIA